MRKATWVLAVLAVVAIPAAAGDLGVMASFWSPDDIDDDTRGGFYVDFPMGRLDFQGRAIFYEEMEYSDATQGDFLIDPTTLEAGLAWTFPTRREAVEPFVGGGFSYVDFKMNRGGRIKDEFGWYGVAGVDWNFRHNGSLRGEVMYRVLDAEIQGGDLGVGPGDERFTDIPLDLNGVSVNLGVAYHW